MKNEVQYLMSQSQLNRYAVLSQVIQGNLNVSEAASALGISKRQVLRLKKGVQQQGAAALIHKNTGRKPSHALDESLISQIVSLKQSALYCDANFRHFCELLERRENITISYSSLHTLLSQAGLKSPKKRRRIKLHRRRKRKEQEGLLLQVDATPFEWFGGTEKFALHGAIDDATGKVAGLYLTKHECLHGYWELTRRLIRRHGIPASIYADRHAIFLSRNAGKLSLEDQLGGKVVNDTQFGRAMTELGITLIAARSPQAKGRVERLWDTLQSRLPIEFALAKITTIDQANDFLASYIESFNEQFAVVPIDSVCAFRPAPSDLDLDSILCIKMTRILDAGAVFSFYNRHFVLQPGKRRLELPAKTAISVLVSPLFGIRAQYKQTVFDVLPYIRETKSTEERNEVRKKSNWTPPDSHYFKYGHSLVKKLTFEDNNFDILHLLEDIFLKKYA